MFQLKTRLTNTRPTKDEKPEVSTTPTKGNFKINSAGALAIGVKDGDYLDVVVGEDESGDAIFIAKGTAPVKEGDKTVQSAVGAKLASANGKMSGTLNASSANAYLLLKGNKENNLVYSIDTENSQSYTDNGNTSTYYKLVFDRTEEREVRKSSKVSEVSQPAE